MIVKKSNFEIEAERERKAKEEALRIESQRLGLLEEETLSKLKSIPLYQTYKSIGRERSSIFNAQANLRSRGYEHGLVLDKIRKFAKEHKVEVIADLEKERLPKNLRSFSLRRYIGPRNNTHGVRMSYIDAGDYNLDLYVFNPKDVEVLGDIERRVYSLGDKIHDEAIFGSFRDRIDLLFEIRIFDYHESGIARMPGDFQTEERELIGVL
jgi:hypothetical protein